jgi:hypothetical protein
MRNGLDDRRMSSTLAAVYRSTLSEKINLCERPYRTKALPPRVWPAHKKSTLAGAFSVICLWLKAA